MDTKVTAVLRLKNEAEWLRQCLKSIENLFDEILLCTQGKQTDSTIFICKLHTHKNPKKFKHFHYEFDSRPNGPNHFDQPMDQFSRAYFYNWCFRKAKNEWVCKWDGDMIALPSLKNKMKDAVKNNYALKFKGIDVVKDLYHIGQREFCASEIRLYQKGRYVIGKFSESLILNKPTAIKEIDEPLFVHTKWLKSKESITKAWPHNWEDIPHFQNIWKRIQPVSKHKWKSIIEDAGM